MHLALGKLRILLLNLLPDCFVLESALRSPTCCLIDTIRVRNQIPNPGPKPAGVRVSLRGESGGYQILASSLISLRRKGHKLVVLKDTHDLIKCQLADGDQLAVFQDFVFNCFPIHPAHIRINGDSDGRRNKRAQTEDPAADRRKSKTVIFINIFPGADAVLDKHFFHRVQPDTGRYRKRCIKQDLPSRRCLLIVISVFKTDNL